MAEKAVSYKFRKNDEVKIIAGKDKGKSGRILKVDHKAGRVVVEGLNMVKKSMKKKRQNDRGGIIEVEAAVDISNVMVLCKKCGPTRVGYTLEGESKRRRCRKCGEVL